MREIPASQAKTHLAQLLDEVERGEIVAITRHGRRIARIVSETGWRRQEIEEALANIETLARENKKRHGEMSVSEILALRHEGHKY